MCYFLRVFSQSTAFIDPFEMAERTKCSASSLGGKNWQEASFLIPANRRSISLERSFVLPGSEIRQEIEEFTDELGRSLGANANWVADYIKHTKVVYTFEVQARTELDYARRLQKEVWLTANGLLQSDISGFQDELGYLVVPPESTKIKGAQRVALLIDGRWVRFSIDANDETQYRSFLRGEVPTGVAVHSVG